MSLSRRWPFLAVAILTAAAWTPRAALGEQPELPQPGQIGTTNILLNGFPAKRLGIVAYCADLAPGADQIGLQDGGPFETGAGSASRGRFMNVIGHFGGKNVLDYFYYDDSIDRPRDVVLVDGDREQPTATQLIQNFDVVIAYTDNRCGVPIPAAIANQAANALAGFIAAPNKGLILTGFAFSSSIGFGDAIFAGGLSPIRKGGPAVDTRCTRDTPCAIGSCAGLAAPDGSGQTCAPVDVPAVCRDPSGNYCGGPAYQPFVPGAPGFTDLACDHLLINVKGPTSSSWATALTPASVANGATLCFNYNNLASPRVPFLAINRARNIIAVNAFPPDSKDIQKFWFGCILGNAFEYLAGTRNRCPGKGCPPIAPDPAPVP
jgi:hypothetical protein